MHRWAKRSPSPLCPCEAQPRPARLGHCLCSQPSLGCARDNPHACSGLALYYTAKPERWAMPSQPNIAVTLTLYWAMPGMAVYGTRNVIRAHAMPGDSRAAGSVWAQAGIAQTQQRGRGDVGDAHTCPTSPGGVGYDTHALPLSPVCGLSPAPPRGAPNGGPLRS